MYFFGRYAGNTTITGADNIALGYVSGRNLTSGQKNVLLGSNTGNSLTTGSYNILMGDRAGGYAISSSHAIAMGFQAGMRIVSGTRNIALGYQAHGNRSSTGNDCISLGYRAGWKQTAANFNINLGFESGSNNLTGGKNVNIGYRAGKNETGSNRLYISNSATTTPLIYGEFDTGLLKVNGNLHPDGLIDDLSSLGSTGQILSNDAGKLKWINNSAGIWTQIGSTIYVSGVASIGPNVYIGKDAGINTSSASNNTFVGFKSASAVTSGSYNIGIGNLSGFHLTTGQFNVMVGPSSGALMTTGERNVFIGPEAGYNNNSQGNVFIGNGAGKVNTKHRNIMIGTYSGISNDGYENIFIGQIQTPGAGSVNRKLFIDPRGVPEPFIEGDFNEEHLKVRGGLSLDQITWSSGGGISRKRSVINLVNGGSVIVFPTASGNEGRILFIANSTTSTKTINMQSGDTVNGANSIDIAANSMRMFVGTSATTWHSIN